MSFTTQDKFDFIMHDQGEETLPKERWDELTANDALRAYMLTKWSASRFSADSEEKNDEALTEWLTNSSKEDRLEFYKSIRD